MRQPKNGTPRIGLERPVMETSCGYSNRPVDGHATYCGRPSTVHLTTQRGPEGSAMFACDEHADTARALAWDWHPTGSVCGVPDAMWWCQGAPGHGWCYWPAADAIELELTSEQPAEVLA